MRKRSTITDRITAKAAKIGKLTITAAKSCGESTHERCALVADWFHKDAYYGYIQNHVSKVKEKSKLHYMELRSPLVVRETKALYAKGITVPKVYIVDDNGTEHEIYRVLLTDSHYDRLSDLAKEVVFYLSMADTKEVNPDDEEPEELLETKMGIPNAIQALRDIVHDTYKIPATKVVRDYREGFMDLIRILRKRG